MPYLLYIYNSACYLDYAFALPCFYLLTYSLTWTVLITILHAVLCTSACFLINASSLTGSLFQKSSLNFKLDTRSETAAPGLLLKPSWTTQWSVWVSGMMHPWLTELISHCCEIEWGMAEENRQFWTTWWIQDLAEPTWTSPQVAVALHNLWVLYDCSWRHREKNKKNTSGDGLEFHLAFPQWAVTFGPGNFSSLCHWL